MPVSSVYRVATKGTYRQQKVQWGVHLQQKTSEGSPTDIAQAWVAVVIPLLVAATSVDVNWDSVLVTDTSPSGLLQYELPLTQPSPGAITGDSLPTQCAVVVSLLSNVKGRRTRGRFYLPGISETDTTQGNLVGPQLTAIQALANGLEANFGVSNVSALYKLVVWSPVDTVAPPPKPFKPRPTQMITDITSYRVDPIIRTQRRRAIGVGR